MRMFESWKDSLRLCTFDKITLFIKLTIKSMRDVLYTLATPWFFIPVGLLFGTGLLSALYHPVGLVLLGAVSSVVALFELLAARPSMRIKDFSYFKDAMLSLLWLCFIGLSFAFLFALSVMVLQAAPMFSFIFFPFYIVFALFSLMPAFVHVMVLFYLDRKDDGVLKAVVRACTMVWYNFPMFALYVWGLKLLVLLFVLPPVALGVLSYAALYDIPFGLIPQNVPFFMQLLCMIVSWLLTLFNTCLVTNLYVKRLHDQFNLYFPEDE